ncbi:hypothetical protein D3C86_1238310 [compost metagenome]
MAVGFDFLVHEGFDFERAHVAADHDAQVVRDELHELRVFGDARVFAEDRAGARVLDMRFDGHQAFAARLVQQDVQKRHELHVDVLAVTRAFQRIGQRLLHQHQRLLAVACQESPKSRAKDQRQLKRLIKRAQMAAQPYETADDRHDHHEKTDNNQHIRPLPTKSEKLASMIPCPPRPKKAG